MINSNKDGILSTSEMRDFCSKLDIYLTEEETMKVVKMMDLDGDDRIEERDFVSFMKKDSDHFVKKAYRMRETASVFRRWLMRGINPMSPGQEVYKYYFTHTQTHIYIYYTNIIFACLYISLL